MDVLVFSHLRWNFVFQRPQHLMTRCAKDSRVFFWEEPCFEGEISRLNVAQPSHNVTVLTPHLPVGLTPAERIECERHLLTKMLADNGVKRPLLWYYTPLSLPFSRNLNPAAIVYDCMDELSAFRGAPPGLGAAEAELFRRADLVFTGGKTLFEKKRHQHHSVHCFPSSIDRKFFATARKISKVPADQGRILHPRLGYCGVIDERMDMGLLAGIAELRPEWQFVMLGPVVKVDPSELPQRPNIHYLGAKEYSSLPSYFAGWDAGLLPFARNESTRFISPTKTPEYLAAGLPVVSTSITDVVDPYATNGLVHIADDPADFVAEAEKAMVSRNSKYRLARVDSFLSRNSWDQTWAKMKALMEEAIEGKARIETQHGTIVRPMAAD